MDSSITFLEYRIKGRHDQCKNGIYKKGLQFYRDNYPYENNHLIRRFNHYEDNQHNYHYGFNTDNYIGCDNCVKLWIYQELDSKSEQEEEVEKIVEILKKLEIFEEENFELKEDINRLKQEIKEKNNQPKEEINDLKKEINRLKQENNNLKYHNNQLKKLKKDNNRLKQENTKWNQENNRINQQNILLKKNNDQIKQENDGLKEQLNQSKQYNNQLIQDNIFIKSKLNEIEIKNNDFLTNKKLLITEFESVYEKNEELFEKIKHTINTDILNINRDICNYNIIMEEKEPNQTFYLIPELVVDNIKYLDEFTCLFCTNIVDSPIQCQECEIIYCGNCINKYTSEQKNECPSCRKTPFKSQTLPKFSRNFLEELNFLCPLKCGETFEYSNKQKHLASCKIIKNIYKCNLCNEVLTMQKGIMDHHKPKCRRLKIDCPYCKKGLLKFDYESHLSKCPKSFVHCKNCKINISSYYQDAHNSFFCNEIKNLFDSVFFLIHKLNEF